MNKAGKKLKNPSGHAKNSPKNKAAGTSANSHDSVFKSGFANYAALLLTLFVICLVICAADSAAQRRISVEADRRTFETYNLVLPADSYEKTGFDAAAHPDISCIAVASDGSGWVVTSSFEGAKSTLTMVTGVDSDCLCTGISIISHGETEGLGAVAADPGEDGAAFRSQFAGAGEDVSLIADGGEIDAVTGATITSRAITEAVSDAVSAVKALN